MNGSSGPSAPKKVMPLKSSVAPIAPHASRFLGEEGVLIKHKAEGQQICLVPSLQLGWCWMGHVAARSAGLPC